MKKKKKQSINWFVYFRCIFPILTAIVSLILSLVPCYRYKTADTGLNKPISLRDVIVSGWETVRKYLFGGGETEKVVSDFSWVLLLIIIVFAVIFVVGVAFAVYFCIHSMSYYALPDRDSQGHILFVTLVPNRIVECIYRAAVLPLFALPVLMPVLYDRFLYYYVELYCDPFDMLWIALGMYAVTVAVIFVSAYFEKKSGADVFAKREAPLTVIEELEVKPRQSKEESAYEQMNDAAKKEQMERILRMLNKDTKED